MIRPDPERGSLSPHGMPTSLVELGEALRERPDWLEGLHAGLQRLDAARIRHFPDNLFCDYDFLARSLLEEAAGRAAYLDEQLERLETLYAIYGCESTLRFRYLHDFLYGFDWAKYAQRNPDYARVPPFHRVFLEFMLHRGRELLELVDADDPTYHRLRNETHRNPFPFPRGPEAETRLFRKLARRQLLPVPAWRMNARPDATLPYRQLREDLAQELGLGHNTESS